MPQRGDYAREICYFVIVHASSFPLQPVRIILLIISSLFTLALAGDIAFFFYRVHNVVLNACIYICMYACP